jgi:hypothetical protein
LVLIGVGSPDTGRLGQGRARIPLVSHVAAILAVWVVIEARRRREEAHPWIVFVVVGSGLSLLLLAATWLTSGIRALP